MCKLGIKWLFYINLAACTGTLIHYLIQAYLTKNAGNQSSLQHRLIPAPLLIGCRVCISQWYSLIREFQAMYQKHSISIFFACVKRNIFLISETRFHYLVSYLCYRNGLWFDTVGMWESTLSKISSCSRLSTRENLIPFFRALPISRVHLFNN